MPAPVDVTQILIEALPFSGPHGWYEYERAEGCHFTLDAVLTLNTRRAAATDRLADTIDYVDIARCLLAVGEGPSVHLVERLAERMMGALFDAFPTIEAVDLTVRKLRPPVPGAPAAVGVRVARHRDAVR